MLNNIMKTMKQSRNMNPSVKNPVQRRLKCQKMEKESEESSNAFYDFHWPDGNISFHVPN